MSDRIYAATRKGLFTIERNAKRWEISNVDFLGDPVTMFLHDARDGRQYAALSLGHFGVKLHRSDDDGRNWEEVAVPAYAEHDEMNTRDGGKKPASLSEIWSLETGGHDQPEFLWAGTIPGGLFFSRDRGGSWQLVRSLWDRPDRSEWFGGGKDDPGIHSVCVDPRNSRRVTVGISCGGVWISDDAGETFHPRSDGMRAEYMPPEKQFEPNIQDPHRVVQCAGQPDSMWVQHHNGIFRTVDGANSWQEMEGVAPSAFGFAAAVHPRNGDVAWFVPGVKDDCRVPVDARMVVTRTSDGGNTFELLDRGLPQQHAYDIVFRHGLDIDATGNRLVMGSSTGSLWTSEDGGETWHSFSAHLPQIYCVQFAP